uniref:Uncharacterized protein n=1 Tax=Arundo donax TaxID=35708 RepID=A0A0A9A2T9_ARUDO
MVCPAPVWSGVSTDLGMGSSAAPTRMPSS